MKKILVSDKEEELIAAIRNYKKSFPRGNPQLLWYAQQLFDEMIERLSITQSINNRPSLRGGH